MEPVPHGLPLVARLKRRWWLPAAACSMTLVVMLAAYVFEFGDWLGGLRDPMLAGVLACLLGLGIYAVGALREARLHPSVIAQMSGEAVCVQCRRAEDPELLLGVTEVAVYDGVGWSDERIDVVRIEHDGGVWECSLMNRRVQRG